MLQPGDRTGHYRRGTTALLGDDDGGSRISAEDLAVAIVDELEKPAAEPQFTVAYWAAAKKDWPRCQKASARGDDALTGSRAASVTLESA